MRPLESGTVPVTAHAQSASSSELRICVRLKTGTTVHTVPVLELGLVFERDQCLPINAYSDNITCYKYYVPIGNCFPKV